MTKEQIIKKLRTMGWTKADIADLDMGPYERNCPENMTEAFDVYRKVNAKKLAEDRAELAEKYKGDPLKLKYAMKFLDVVEEKGLAKMVSANLCPPSKLARIKVPLLKQYEKERAAL